MGHTSHPRNVLLFLSALETALKTEKFKVQPGALDAAAAVYQEK
jgi:hypothetical protein